jgi:CheY-like chemotaxis protein
LLKPVKPSEVLDFLDSSTPAAEGLPSAPHPATQSIRSARILLAEDGLVNQKLAMSLLTRQGHRVTIAATGKEALAALQRESFDLVLMDVHMPEMDGFEATQAIRAREQQSGSRLPILAMTASSSLHDTQRCLTAGMDGFVAKPVRQEQLFTTIERHLKAAGATNGLFVVDWPTALRQAGGQHEQLEERVALLLQELPRVQSDLTTAAAASDLPALRMAAHTLKIALSAIGAGQAAQLAESLETSSPASDSAAVEGLLARFQQASQQLMAALQQFRGAACE